MKQMKDNDQVFLLDNFLEATLHHNISHNAPGWTLVWFAINETLNKRQ